MAKQLSYTDAYGDTYPQSYWRPEQWNFAKNGSGMVFFLGYTDAAHKGKRIIGQKQYAVTSEEFSLYFSAAILSPDGINPIKQCYEYADKKLDTDSGEKDADGKPVLKSFFEGSTDVL